MPSSGQKSFDLDALIVGAGIGGVYAVYKLRQLGLSVRVFEAGPKLGGVWQWNQYPGARVDSEYPFYQLSIPEVYKTWSWSERFPSYTELRDYFDHADKVLKISEDSTFNADVVSASFDQRKSKWTVKTRQGHTATCKYLLLCTGSTYKTHYPDFKGMSDYKGILHHTSRYPADGVDVSGKKVAVIGQGATGVQVVQELSRKAGSMTVFLRTPNTALPMGQRKMSREEQTALIPYYSAIFRGCRKSYGGFPYSPPPSASFASASPEERQALYEELYARGAFGLVVGIWPDYLVDPTANRAVYDFWAKKTRARISDPVKRDLLAPLEPQHPFGTKRPSLEQDYYECMDSPNVKIVDMGKTEILEFTKTGITTTDGESHEFDVIILATGYDNYTGAFATMGLKDTNGVELSTRWKDGVHTYLGLMCSRFPNMFMVYGPQGTWPQEHPVS